MLMHVQIIACGINVLEVLLLAVTVKLQGTSIAVLRPRSLASLRYDPTLV